MEVGSSRAPGFLGIHFDICPRGEATGVVAAEFVSPCG